MLNSFENFNEQEKDKLSKYVTNLDKSIFALRNLPEVVKGALFSKYSRSKLGLRSLLLKEFIESDNNSFEGITQAKEGAENQEVAILKAQKFYDRVLDGYGDDSIGELGGAHLAIEEVSIIASKLIEDARIGGSPLEKSTRYIFFNEKVNGEYRFLKEPNIIASKYKDLYLETCNFLFDTYKEMIDPLTSYVKKLEPQEEGVSDIVYNNTVRARVCDALRGLLPASTLTNLGLYGNGRFFEFLIQKLKVSDLKELKLIGEHSLNELNKVIPSFVRKAATDHKHFINWCDFFTKSNELLQKNTEELLDNVTDHDCDSVQLVDYDKDGVKNVAAAMLYEFSNKSLKEIMLTVKDMNSADLEKLFASCYNLRTNRRHKPSRAFEHVFYTFDLLGDFGMFRDLHRHRILTQKRQPLSTNYGYYTPKDIIDSGLKDKYDQAMQKAQMAYNQIVIDFPEEAQYIVPISYNIRWYFKINLRSLIWLCELRTVPQGHASYRKMAQEMARKVMEVEPLLAPFFKFVDFNDYELGRLEQEKQSENKKELKKG